MLELEVSQKVIELINASHVDGNIALDRYINYWLIGDITESTRNEVLDRDNHKCVICKSKSSLHIHHLIKRKYGGSHNTNNLVTLCSKCHGYIETNDIEYATKKCIKNALIVNRFIDDDDTSTNKEKAYNAKYVLTNLFKRITEDYVDEKDILKEINIALEYLDKIE